MLAKRGPSVWLAAATYKERGCAPGSLTSRATVASHHMLGRGFGWQRGARGSRLPKVLTDLLAGPRMGAEPHPRTASQAPATADTLGPVSSGEFQDANRHGAPALPAAPAPCCRGKASGQWGSVYSTTSSLSPIQRLTRIRSSTNTLPVGRLRDSSVSLEILFAPKVIRRSSSLGWWSLQAGLWVQQIVISTEGSPWPSA